MSRTVLDEPASPCFPFAPRIHSDPIGFGSSDIIEALSSPEDGIKKNLTIDMKDLVGDAVGNMSISPSYRDLVLAAYVRPFVRPHDLIARPCEGAMASSS
jgi:hypothetical protein